MQTGFKLYVALTGKIYTKQVYIRKLHTVNSYKTWLSRLSRLNFTCCSETVFSLWLTSVKPLLNWSVLKRSRGSWLSYNQWVTWSSNGQATMFKDTFQEKFWRFAIAHLLNQILRDANVFEGGIFKHGSRWVGSLESPWYEKSVKDWMCFSEFGFLSFVLINICREKSGDVTSGIVNIGPQRGFCRVEQSTC